MFSFVQKCTTSENQVFLIYIKLVIKSKDSIDNLTRKLYIDKMFSECCKYNDSKRNNGVINKFNNAIGFKDVVLNFDNFNASKPVKVESPDRYISPKEMLFEGLCPSFIENEIMYFLSEKKYINHPNSNFSYSTLDIYKKLQKFILKVFPVLDVEILKLNEKPKIPLKTIVLNDFFIGISPKFDHYSVECSASRLLENKEISEILNVINSIRSNNVNINQAYCKTCSDYDNKNPYHVEIIYTT